MVASSLKIIFISISSAGVKLFIVEMLVPDPFEPVVFGDGGHFNGSSDCWWASAESAVSIPAHLLTETTFHHRKAKPLKNSQPRSGEETISCKSGKVSWKIALKWANCILILIVSVGIAGCKKRAAVPQNNRFALPSCEVLPETAFKIEMKHTRPKSPLGQGKFEATITNTWHRDFADYQLFCQIGSNSNAEAGNGWKIGEKKTLTVVLWDENPSGRIQINASDREHPKQKSHTYQGQSNSTAFYYERSYTFGLR